MIGTLAVIESNKLTLTVIESNKLKFNQTECDGKPNVIIVKCTTPACKVTESIKIKEKPANEVIKCDPEGPYKSCSNFKVIQNYLVYDDSI